MCGIVGWFKVDRKAPLDVDALLKTMVACRAGGLDSSGFMIQRLGQDAFIAHSVTPIEDLIEQHKDCIRQIITKSDIGMVHTRHATIGEVNLSNAQPFSKYPYVMCHNGHINGLGNKEQSDSKELGTILMTKGMDAIKPYINRGWANLAIYDLERRLLTLSPDPFSQRMWVKYCQGYMVFGSVGHWLHGKGQVWQLKTTMEYKIGTTQRRRLDSFRAKKVLPVHSTSTSPTVYRAWTDKYTRRMDGRPYGYLTQAYN